MYTLEKDKFADLAHFYKHSVLEMVQLLVSELISPVFMNGNKNSSIF